MTKGMQRKLRLYSSTGRFFGGGLPCSPSGVLLANAFPVLFHLSLDISPHIRFRAHQGLLCVFFPFVVHHGVSRDLCEEHSTALCNAFLGGFGAASAKIEGLGFGIYLFLVGFIKSVLGVTRS